MPLQKQYKEFPLALGIDTKTDPFQLQLGQLSTAENAVFTTPKQTKKRNGYTAVGNTIEGGTTTISNPKFITSFQNQKIQGTNTTLYSRSDGTSKWTSKGNAISAKVTNTVVDSETGSNNTDVNQDGAYSSNGLFLSCWEVLQSSSSVGTAAGAYYSISDYSTSDIIASRVLLSSTAINPKAFALSGYFFVFYVDTSNNHLKLVTIPTTAPLSPNAAVDVTTNINSSNPFYDVTIMNNTLYMAYNTSAAGNGIGLRHTDTSLVISGETQVAGENASKCISIIGDSGNAQLWVSYSNGTTIRAFCRDTSFTQVLAATTVETISNVRNATGYASSGTLTVYYEIYTTESNVAAGFYIEIKKNTITTGGTVGTAALFLMNAGIISKFFTFNSTKYLIVSYQSVVQGTYFVIDTSKNVVAKILPESAGGYTNQVYLASFVASTLCEVNSIDANNFVAALLQQKGVQYFTKLSNEPNLSSFAQNTICGTIYSAISFNSSTYQNVDIANGLHLVGGALALYDGISSTEHGFFVYPESVVLLTGGGGGNLSNGAYSYQVTYEWTDNFGQLHVSAPSIAQSITLNGGGSSQSVVVRVSPLFNTAKSQVNIVIYRTAASGTAYYRVPIVTNNDVTQPYISITDTAAADLSGYKELYTDTGEVDNIQVPTTNIITTYKTRMLAVPTEKPTQFWFSKEIVPGSPVEFSDQLTWNITTQGGDITTLKQMDDKLIIFKSDDIFYMGGDGPAPNGAQNDFTNPQRIPTDVGCPPANVNSVVLMPNGIMFQSAKGIYLLDRSLQVSYIGAPVETYNSSTVTSAILITNKREVRFGLSTGEVLVFNYFVGQWSVFTNLNTISATLWNDTYTVLNSTQALEESSSFDDNGSFIKKKIVTGWLNMTGIQGFQRVYRIILLGVWKSSHTLVVNLYGDYNPNPFQTSYITATSAVMTGTTYGTDTPYGSPTGVVFGGTYNGLYQWIVNPSIQRLEALQISIEDSQDTTYGEGYALSNIAFEVGVEGGVMRLPASNKVS